jgi:hypothetical protein
MGTCTLTFERTQILFKKSDRAHQDNDWLFVTWFVGPNPFPTNPIKLENLAETRASMSATRFNLSEWRCPVPMATS